MQKIDAPAQNIYNALMKRDKRHQHTPEAVKEASLLEQVALGATTHIGSLPSLVIHSFFFIGIFGLQWFGVSFNQIMLVLTTVVSLEAIYLSIFIQMTVNRQAHQIAEVSEDIDEIQEDVEEIQEDVDEIQEDVEEIQEDAKEISEDVGEIKEDVEELSDEIEKEVAEDVSETEKIRRIEHMLEELLREVKVIQHR